MSIKYSLMELRNPLRPQDEKRVYAKAQVREKVGLNTITEEISYSTSRTDGDVMSALRALMRITHKHLADGDMVELGDFGTFQYQLSSDAADTKEEFTHANIRKVRLQFRPGRMWKPNVKDFQFERVISVEARRLAKKNG